MDIDLKPVLEKVTSTVSPVDDAILKIINRSYIAKEKELIVYYKSMKTFDQFIRELRPETLQEKMMREVMMLPKWFIPTGEEYMMDTM